MPQIKVFLSPIGLKTVLPEMFCSLGLALTMAVESAFGIEGKKDVAFDIFSILHTRNEASVQIEVVYTAGEDEYKTGKLFDPTKEQKELAINLIIVAFSDCLLKYGIEQTVPSVWILPQYHCIFKAGDVI